METFIEPDWRKSVLFILIAALLTVGTAVTVIANNRWSLLEGVNDSFARLVADVQYRLEYGSQVNYFQNAAADTGSGYAEAIPVLLYHGTPPEGNNNPPLPQSTFVEQMRALKADGWQTITMDQFDAFIKRGAPLPAKSFLLTFDDGRKESFYPVDPVLKELGYSAVMFVITGFSLPQHKTRDSTFYLSADELRYMAGSGRWDIESHGDQDHGLYSVPSPYASAAGVGTITDQHYLSNKFWIGHIETNYEYENRVTNDLERSKQILENLTGDRVIAFAYPFNDYGQGSVNYPNALQQLPYLVQQIYTYAFHQVDPHRSDPYNYPDPNAFTIKRVEPLASWSGSDLVALLDSSYPRATSYESTTFGPEWIDNWGTVESSGTSLQLHASEKTTGATALLGGSAPWTDYDMQASILWLQGTSVSLIARYVSDSSPYVSCAFDMNKIEVQKHDNGVVTALTSAPYAMSGTTLAALMSVKGSTVACSAFGAQASTTVSSAFVHSGEAGVQVWDSRTGLAHIEVTQFSAHEL